MVRVALITGASRGIGASTALMLAEHEYRVVVNYRASGPVFRQLSARAGPVSALCLQSECHAEMPETRFFSRVSAKRPCRCPARPMDRLQVQVLVPFTGSAGSTPVFGTHPKGLCLLDMTPLVLKMSRSRERTPGRG